MYELLVEDSALIRTFLREIIEDIDGVYLIAEATEASDALLNSCRPQQTSLSSIYNFAKAAVLTRFAGYRGPSDCPASLCSAIRLAIPSAVYSGIWVPTYFLDKSDDLQALKSLLERLSIADGELPENIELYFSPRTTSVPSRTP